MMRKNIIIVVTIVLIIICFIIGIKNNNREMNLTTIEKGQETQKEIVYNVVTNETTGNEEYVIYNKETGEEITRVEEEYQIKAYELDPDFEELTEDASYEEIQEESIIE